LHSYHFFIFFFFLLSFLSFPFLMLFVLLHVFAHTQIRRDGAKVEPAKLLKTYVCLLLRTLAFCHLLFWCCWIRFFPLKLLILRPHSFYTCEVHRCSMMRCWTWLTTQCGRSTTVIWRLSTKRYYNHATIIWCFTSSSSSKTRRLRIYRRN
jgi:hypothetical protein